MFEQVYQVYHLFMLEHGRLNPVGPNAQDLCAKYIFLSFDRPN